MWWLVAGITLLAGLSGLMALVRAGLLPVGGLKPRRATGAKELRNLKKSCQTGNPALIKQALVFYASAHYQLPNAAALSRLCEQQDIRQHVNRLNQALYADTADQSRYDEARNLYRSVIRAAQQHAPADDSDALPALYTT